MHIDPSCLVGFSNYFCSMGTDLVPVAFTGVAFVDFEPSMNFKELLDHSTIRNGRWDQLPFILVQPKGLQDIA